MSSVCKGNDGRVRKGYYIDHFYEGLFESALSQMKDLVMLKIAGKLEKDADNPAFDFWTPTNYFISGSAEDHLRIEGICLVYHAMDMNAFDLESNAELFKPIWKKA